MSQTDLLNVAGLSLLGDKQKKLLDDVSFSIAANEVVGVLGPNGAGKTTLLRCLFGALQNYTGSISLKGKDIRSLSGRQRALSIAAVTQEMPVDFQLTVASVIATGRTPHQHWLSGKDAEGERVIRDIVQQFGLQKFLNMDLNELSGGERKRVMICRALVQQPTLLILDEPCNHLDIQHQLGLMQLLRELPMSSLVSLHDFPMAARYCDRVIILDQGRLIKYGNVADVLTTQLFDQVFSVQAQTYYNPWEQWSFHAKADLNHYANDNTWYDRQQIAANQQPVDSAIRR